jgi:hypothetical protein
MRRQSHDGNRGNDKADVRGSVIVHGTHASIYVRVRIIVEDSAQYEKKYEGKSEGKDHGDGLAHEELELYQVSFNSIRII